MPEVILDAAGRRRSPATMRGYLAGRTPRRNKGRRYPADPPRVEEIVAVMRTAGTGAYALRTRGLIAVLWRAGLRVSGKGFLTGAIDENTEFETNDFRDTVPRFNDPDARKANRAFVELLQRIADRRHATPAQVALAWLLTRKPWITPIPRTTKLHRLEENVAEADVGLSEDDLLEIEDAQIEAQGARYSEANQRMIDR